MTAQPPDDDKGAFLMETLMEPGLGTAAESMRATSTVWR